MQWVYEKMGEEKLEKAQVMLHGALLQGSLDSSWGESGREDV